MRRCELCGEEWDARRASGATEEARELSGFGGALWELVEACGRCGCLRDAASQVARSGVHAA